MNELSAVAIVTTKLRPDANSNKQSGQPQDSSKEGAVSVDVYHEEEAGR